ncbi:MAG: HDIG domain-containing protein [Myxococcales bacterium]|nr:MAG: HDIG domain-containing protein [Myxococcales bacterium]
MLRTRLIASLTAGFVLSSVAATVLTLANTAESFFEPLRVDPAKPAPVTLRLPVTAVPFFDPETGRNHVQIMQPTVERGQTVDDPILAALVRAYEVTRRPPTPERLIGLWLIYFLILTMLTTYLRRFSPGRGALLRTQVGLLMMVTLLLIATKLLYLLTPLPSYCVPVAAATLWVARYLDRRSAFIVSIGLSFLTSSFSGFSLDLLAVFLAGTMTANLVLGQRRSWTGLINAGFGAAIASATMLIAARFLFYSSFDLMVDISDPFHSVFLAAAAGGLLSGPIALVLEGPAVILLGAVSRSRLLDLSDLDQPLLQKMAKEAPGSWEHSRAMANLAEEASAAVGADALLTRIGAYYHDLGKTCQCKYFIENLEPGEVSPHEKLEPDVSADAIMHHVIEGTNILRRGGIPEPVIEFAYTHHGTSVTEYFWHKCLERGNPKELPESYFRYPGMRPRTKETAILMLIDSIEAASRTIDPPEREKFAEMVQRIIFVKLKQGQLDESGLTAEDLRILSTQLTETLCNVYHTRIRYPWQDAKDKGEQPLPVPGLATEKDMIEEHTANLHAMKAAAESEQEQLEGTEEP